VVDMVGWLVGWMGGWEERSCCKDLAKKKVDQPTWSLGSGKVSRFSKLHLVSTSNTQHTYIRTLTHTRIAEVCLIIHLICINSYIYM
jgi:hypothetical protein